MRALVERYQGPVFGLCFRMLASREDAEDTVQEVFLRTFRSLHRWDSTRPLKPWILTIAANRCRTALKRRMNRPIPTDVADISPLDYREQPTHGVAEEVQRGLDQLRDEYRLCFTLFHQNELSLTEVASVMDRPEGTIKTWLHRARQELADHLRRRGFEAGVSNEVRTNAESTSVTG